MLFKADTTSVSKKQKRKTTTSVVVFLVEISGIEPLTS